MSAARFWIILRFISLVMPPPKFEAQAPQIIMGTLSLYEDVYIISLSRKDMMMTEEIIRLCFMITFLTDTKLSQFWAKVHSGKWLNPTTTKQTVW